mmetsp:Transcript_89200/g.260788  ORF Transcript_89200/g.260788 Transcript_89200/m.260788 type:complete len:241 (-) Transcript_89200:14-736(-)
MALAAWTSSSCSRRRRRCRSAEMSAGFDAELLDALSGPGPAATDDERMGQMLDVLNGEGELIMKRTRADVHRNGFWHRAVNIWIICPSTTRLLMGQRAAGKDMDPHRWSCAAGRVPSGDLSMNTAISRLAAEYSITAVADRQIGMAFSMRCPRTFTSGLFSGQQDAAWVDVYIATLDEELPLSRLHLDTRAKQAARYVSLAELRRAFEVRDEAYVIPPNDEYCKKLLHYLRKTCESAVPP